MRSLKQSCFYILLFTFITLLTACGFHLRGEEKLPGALQVVYIQSDTPYGSFEQTLRDSLRSYNIKLVDTPQQAKTILNIMKVNLASVAGSVSANLSLRQYTLNYTITYNVLTPNSKIILSTNSVTATTTFTSDMAAMMLSSKNSTQQYMPELQRDAVFRIMSQLLSSNSRATLDTYSRTGRIPKHEN